MGTNHVISLMFWMQNVIVANWSSGQILITSIQIILIIYESPKRFEGLKFFFNPQIQVLCKHG